MRAQSPVKATTVARGSNASVHDAEMLVLLGNGAADQCGAEPAMDRRSLNRAEERGHS
jgi:hypothetical protein